MIQSRCCSNIKSTLVQLVILTGSGQCLVDQCQILPSIDSYQSNTFCSISMINLKVIIGLSTLMLETKLTKQKSDTILPQSHEHFNADWIRDKYYIPGLPRDRSHGKRGRFGLNEITRDIFDNSRPYSGGGANVLSRDKAFNWYYIPRFIVRLTARWVRHGFNLVIAFQEDE